MNFAITVYGNPPEAVAPVAQHAEELGFYRILTGEHVVLPLGLDDQTIYRLHHETNIASATADHHFDIWVMVGNILGATSRIRVTTAILIAALRHPLVQVRSLLTALSVAQGRFELGVGIGWSREEYEALGVPFESRGRRFDEILDIFERAAAGGPFEFHGEFYDFPLVQMTPTPVDLPLIIGGSSPRSIERAALRGRGWTNATDCDLDDCIAIRSRILEIRDEHGLQDQPFEFLVRLVRAPTESEIERYAAAGFENLVMSWSHIHSPEEGGDLASRFRSLDAVAKIVGLSG